MPTVDISKDLSDLIHGVSATIDVDADFGSKTGEITAAVTVAGIDVTLTATRSAPSQGLVFEGKVPQINLSALIAEYQSGITLPPEIPDLVLTDVDLTLLPATGAFSFSATYAHTWELPFGVPGLAITATTLTLSRDAADTSSQPTTPGKLHLALELKNANTVEIVDGVDFSALDLTFQYDIKAGWALSGSVAAQVFGRSLTLATSLTEATDSRQFQFAAQQITPESLIALSGVGELTASELTISVTKALGATSAAKGQKLSETSVYTWDIKAVGGMSIEGAFTEAGTLSLYKQADKMGLAFTAINSDVRIPIPYSQAAIHIGLEDVAITRQTGTGGTTTAGTATEETGTEGTGTEGTSAAGSAEWMFDATLDVWFTGLSKSVQAILADKTEGKFSVDAKGAALSIDRVLKPVELPLPDSKLGSLHVHLGTALLDASNLNVTLGKEIAISLDLGVGIPAPANDLFGTHSDGSPRVEFFNTYAKKADGTIDENSVTKARIGGDSVKGLTVQCLTSPIKAITFQVAGDDTWCTADLGDFGAVKFLVPEFSSTGETFTAKGGMQQVRPLKLPLTPLKQLLAACGLEALNHTLPDGIPLREIDIVDAQNNFKVDAFVDLMTQAGIPVPSEVTDALKIVGSRLDDLPDRFKSYLNITIPDGFEFDITVTADGRVRGKVSVDGDKPIKFLFPTMGMFGPEMRGIELYGIAFGEVAGGSLFTLELDCVMDQFDIIEMAAGLALPSDTLRILPSARALAQTTTLRNLFMLVIYETGIPIPIPVFFDELGYDYMGLEGVGLGTHWKLPAPSFDMAEASALFTQFEKFFTKRDYLLDADHPPQHMDLKFTVGANYLQLPKYLGGKLLGSQSDIATISLYQSIAHMLNFMKTLTINEIVQALPLAQRVGTETVTFGFFDMQASWLITTPAEFRKSAYMKIQVIPHDVDTILQVLPAAPQGNDQGLVVFLKGHFDLANTIHLDTVFGLIGTSAGFGTGLRIAGSVSDLLAFQASGVVVIAPHAANVFSLTGHTQLTVLGDNIFTGDLSLTDDHFAFSGDLDLFRHLPALRVTGRLSGRLSKSDLYLDGSVSVTLGHAFQLAAASAVITQQGIRLTGTWLNQTLTFSALNQGGSLQLEASLSPIQIGSVFSVTNAQGNGGPIARLGVKAGSVPSFYLSGAVQLLGAKLSTEIAFSDQGFHFTLTDKIFDVFQATLTAQGGDLTNGDTFSIQATMQNDLFSYLEEKVSKIINDAASDAGSKIKDAESKVADAQNSVAGLDKKIAAMRSTVQSERDRDTGRLNDARNAVNGCQSKVNTLQSQINDCNNTINSLKKDISDKKSWYDNSGWRKSYRWAEYSGYCAEKGVEITGKGTELAGLYVAMKTAEGALDVASATLHGIEQAAASTPIELDPRVAGLITARKTASGALDAANLALEGTRKGLGELGSIASFIATAGIGGLINVHDAGFTTTLNSAKGGEVALSVTLSFMHSTPKPYAFHINFNNPAEGARTLAKQLVPSL